MPNTASVRASGSSPSSGRTKSPSRLNPSLILPSIWLNRGGASWIAPTMDWLLQSSAALLGMTVTLITMGFLVRLSFSSRPDAQMAFLAGLMKGAALEDGNQGACSANPIVHRLPPPARSAISR
jgi:hypothetical protein